MSIVYHRFLAIRFHWEVCVSYPGGGGGKGTCQNFDRDAGPIFWVSNLAKSYFSGFANFLAICLGFAIFPLFFGSDKFPAIFWSSNFCVTHLNPLHEEHTVLKNIKS